MLYMYKYILAWPVVYSIVANLTYSEAVVAAASRIDSHEYQQTPWSLMC